MMMLRPLTFFTFLLLPVVAVLLCATHGSTWAQPRSMGTVTVIGRRMVKLPAARKGEVRDSSAYRLPADSINFGERIANLQIAGIPLPKYADQPDDPLMINYQADIGSLVSPRALLQGVYRKDDYELNATAGFDYTAGHIKSAKATGLLLGVGGGLTANTNAPLLGAFTASGRLDYATDSYTLYGNTAAPNDRWRAATQFIMGIASLPEQRFGCTLDVAVNAGSVEDTPAGTPSSSASAVGTGLGLGLRGGADSLTGTLRLDYNTTSLRYSLPTRTPSVLQLVADAGWHPSPALFLNLGLVYGSAQGSDTGATAQTLLMPRASVRLDLSPALSMFAEFRPELSAMSYRDMLMRAPYADANAVMGAQKTPVSLVAGLHLNTESFSVEAKAIYQKSENTPVVNASDTGTSRGLLRYAYVAETRTLGADANIELEIGDDLKVEGEARIRSSTDLATNAQLPMVPTLNLSGRISYDLNDKLSLFAFTEFASARRTTLAVNNALDLSTALMLTSGGSYQLGEHLWLTAEVSNLLSGVQYLWQNYSAPGIEARAGIRGWF